MNAVAIYPLTDTDSPSARGGLIIVKLHQGGRDTTRGGPHLETCRVKARFSLSIRFRIKCVGRGSLTIGTSSGFAVSVR